MTVSDKYDLQLTDALGESHGLVCDWSKGGAGLKVDSTNDLKSTKVATKGDYGVRDAVDYFRIVQSDWSEGCGQTTYDREVDSENMFLSSTNIDTSKVGSFTLGPATVDYLDAKFLFTACAALKSAGVEPLVFATYSDPPYVVYSTRNETWAGIAGTTPTAPVTSLCSDGQYVYAACADGLFRGTTTGWAKMSATANITHVAVASGTLYGTAGSTSVDAYLATTIPLGSG